MTYFFPSVSFASFGLSVLAVGLQSWVNVQFAVAQDLAPRLDNLALCPGRAVHHPHANPRCADHPRQKEGLGLPVAICHSNHSRWYIFPIHQNWESL